ncbi:S-adenosylmethionine decarboxylase [Anaeromyces robustus]|jgi:S-adenosylmethionine decarboxylase|uniref:adenosylmethionine decarboxylase n=1 Tax=Anaeromyces robustus TaxID=1754192 RepID=A0A1Y1VVY8_9FUNG|nr:S-adenosylmethionine decarboxylase [Anaeromyces robustus]|eukprot:ORX65156.1 S-adenosylmethionine decarboxylase [Anaeromyces robustus]
MMSEQVASSDHQTYYTPVDANPDQQVSLIGFEGPEKLIEIWFKPPKERLDELNEIDDEGNTKGLGLRTVEKEVWDDMLTIVRAQILSITSNQYQDAYLLSESSMFVSPYRFMIKTCGTTTLLNAVPKILEIAKQYCGLETISAFFYSRKCFMFPDRQERPHGSWNDEVDFLEKIFSECSYNTSAYVVGKLNRDHWNLYMATPYDEEFLKYTNSIADLPQEIFEEKIEEKIETIINKEEKNTNKFDKDGISEDDFTLEILMSGLDQKHMKNFWRTEEEKREVMEIEERGDIYVKGPTEERVYEQTGLKSIFPQAQMDHYVFNPCGYSSNALLGKHYYSVHVTPEDICSYASFECNLPLGNPLNQYNSYNELINKVLNIFNPKQFVITLFTRKPEGTLGQIRDLIPQNIKGYQKTDKIIYDLNKWDLAFCQFTKNDIILERIKKSENEQLLEKKMMENLVQNTENMKIAN